MGGAEMRGNRCGVSLEVGECGQGHEAIPEKLIDGAFIAVYYIQGQGKERFNEPCMASGPRRSAAYMYCKWPRKESRKCWKQGPRHHAAQHIGVINDEKKHSLQPLKPACGRTGPTA
jgi:hypothetical protein